jgi:hypothetical protein
MLISTALLLDSNIRNSVCTPAKLPCRRVEVGYLQIIFTVFKTQSTKGNFVAITKFTINIKNMFYQKFLICGDLYRRTTTRTCRHQREPNRPNHGTINHAVHHFLIHPFIVIFCYRYLLLLSNHASSRLIHSGPTKYSTNPCPERRKRDAAARAETTILTPILVSIIGIILVLPYNLIP